MYIKHNAENSGQAPMYQTINELTSAVESNGYTWDGNVYNPFDSEDIDHNPLETNELTQAEGFREYPLAYDLHVGLERVNGLFSEACTAVESFAEYFRR